MAKNAAGLEELLVQELQDLYDAEKQLVRALPKMAKAASSEELQSALREHLEVTKGHVERIEQAFESMDQRARSKPCKGMKGIVEEGSETIQEDLDEGLMDAAITGAARRVEHYEMAGYLTVASMAKQLGLRDVEQLLQATLREEMDADKTLAQIAKRLLKESASSARGTEREESRSTRTSRHRGASGQAASRGGSRTGASRGRSSGKAAHPLTDPGEIRQWAEERGATPACVRGTGGKGDIGMLRLDFPGYSGAESLQPIAWDDWFEKFNERNLALMVQDTTAAGQKSNFNKLVNRKGAQGRSRGSRTRAAH